MDDLFLGSELSYENLLADVSYDIYEKPYVDLTEDERLHVIDVACDTIDGD